MKSTFKAALLLATLTVSTVVTASQFATMVNTAGAFPYKALLVARSFTTRCLDFVRKHQAVSCVAVLTAIYATARTLYKKWMESKKTPEQRRQEEKAKKRKQEDEQSTIRNDDIAVD